MWLYVKFVHSYKEVVSRCGEKQISPSGIFPLSPFKVITPRAGQQADSTGPAPWNL